MANTSPPPISAQEARRRGDEFYDEENYVEAMRWYRIAADQGHPSAPLYIAWLYVYALGVDQGLDAASVWLTRAAERGESASIASLRAKIARLRAGYGLDVSLDEAVCWLVTWRWGLTVRGDGAAWLDKMYFALMEIRQAARDGDVRVWGTRRRSGPHLEIDQAFWADHEIDELTLAKPSEDDPVATMSSHGKPRDRYTQLMVSRAEFERRAWPRARY